MNILVLHDENEIQGWIINDPTDAPEEDLQNGHAPLLTGWNDKSITASVITVPDKDMHRPDRYIVAEGAIVKKKAKER